MHTLDTHAPKTQTTTATTGGAPLFRESAAAEPGTAPGRGRAAVEAARSVASRMSPTAWVMESLAAGVLSTAALMLLGRRETGSAVAPLNATSHILWGDEAALVDDADWKHTGVGQALHHASAFFWGVLFEALQARRTRPTPAGVVTDAALTTAVAAVVDYQLVPERFTPGFEKRLSRQSLAIAYGALAAGLVMGGMAALRKRPS